MKQLVAGLGFGGHNVAQFDQKEMKDEEPGWIAMNSI
jgi:hypothetical protein